MVEIAISLAVIGIALVAILGVLPLGMRMQRDNRETTLINQDATVFIEAIRSGAGGGADLTNYVFAVTNAWTLFNPDGSVNKADQDGYTYQGSLITRIPSPPFFPITNNYRIIGLLSLPEYTDASGAPLPGIVTNLPGGCYSNHVVAYVHSISGSAVEKPPQDNSLLVQSSFSYRMFCENLPTPMPLPPEWNSSLVYSNIDKVFYVMPGGEITYWRSLSITNSDTPGQSARWARDGYTETMVQNSRELRLTFLWPLLPNNSLPPMATHLAYRTVVAGQLSRVSVVTNVTPTLDLYFFQSQSFTTNAP